jgi:hypothetical protein
MPDAMQTPTLDFAGFIDGFQARNLASIQRNIALQLSDMQTRLSVLRTQTEPNSPMAGMLASVDASFHDPTGSVVDRLALAGERFAQLLIEHREAINENNDLQLQAKGFVRAYLDAAEASRSQRLIDRAVQLADTYGEVTAVKA